MNSMPDDRTLRAVIRDEALRLFADRGPDAVSVRQIAAAAGVSPGLIVHHFGSKEGLREAVDQYVLAIFDRMLSEMSSGGPDLFDAASSGSVAEAILAHLPAGSPVPGYLRRLLLDGSEAGRELFARLFALSARTLDDLAAAGLADPGRDPAVRAAFLLINDLAVLLFRDHLTAVLGADPLSGDGLARWAGEVLLIYSAGLLAAPPAP
ncbi:MAG TPA: TetR family transcriptional regulator [Streptosporangiaceae bacterium]|nr:TetR family transcriptional regulator [Streptosporangiaceae bacterium]